MKGPFRFIREPSGRYVATAKAVPYITSTISISCVTGEWEWAVCHEDVNRGGTMADGFAPTLKRAKEEANIAGLTVTLTAEVNDA
jgi:hypothetical protein